MQAFHGFIAKDSAKKNQWKKIPIYFWYVILQTLSVLFSRVPKGIIDYPDILFYKMVSKVMSASLQNWNDRKSRSFNISFASLAQQKLQVLSPKEKQHCAFRKGNINGTKPYIKPLPIMM